MSKPEKLNDESAHLACLALAQGKGPWGDHIDPSPAMVEVWELFKNHEKAMRDNVSLVRALSLAIDACLKISTRSVEMELMLTQLEEVLCEVARPVVLTDAQHKATLDWIDRQMNREIKVDSSDGVLLQERVKAVEAYEQARWPIDKS